MGCNVYGFEFVDWYCLFDFWSFYLYGYEVDVMVDGYEFEVLLGCIGFMLFGKMFEIYYCGILVYIYVYFWVSGEVKFVLIM